MAYLNKNAFIASEVDSNLFNQISGENMKAYFYENKLSSIEVIGNGESIYYVEDEKKIEAIGVNKIICSDMNIKIKRRQIDNINFYKKPDAILYPMSKININEFFLRGFIWKDKSNIDNVIQRKMDKYRLL